MSQFLREPLLHFLVLGAVIFALFTILDDAPSPIAANRLEVTQDDALRLARQFEATWRRPPTVNELSSLIDGHVEEEVYVREAVALSLDRGDAVVRQRLAQKMHFLTESGAEAAQPTDDDLRAHIEAHPERFARRTVIGFDQVLLAAGEAGAATLASLNAGEPPGDVGAPTLLPGQFPPAPRNVVDGTFGTGFFDAAAALPMNRWRALSRAATGSTSSASPPSRRGACQLSTKSGTRSKATGWPPSASGSRRSAWAR